jgi:hypothetical protein
VLHYFIISEEQQNRQKSDHPRHPHINCPILVPVLVCISSSRIRRRNYPFRVRESDSICTRSSVFEDEGNGVVGGVEEVEVDAGLELVDATELFAALGKLACFQVTEDLRGIV